MARTSENLSRAHSNSTSHLRTHLCTVHRLHSTSYSTAQRNNTQPCAHHNYRTAMHTAPRCIATPYRVDAAGNQVHRHVELAARIEHNPPRPGMPPAAAAAWDSTVTSFFLLLLQKQSNKCMLHSFVLTSLLSFCRSEKQKVWRVLTWPTATPRCRGALPPPPFRPTHRC